MAIRPYVLIRRLRVLTVLGEYVVGKRVKGQILHRYCRSLLHR